MSVPQFSVTHCWEDMHCVCSGRTTHRSPPYPISIGPLSTLNTNKYLLLTPSLQENTSPDTHLSLLHKSQQSSSSVATGPKHLDPNFAPKFDQVWLHEGRVIKSPGPVSRIQVREKKDFLSLREGNTHQIWPSWGPRFCLRTPKWKKISNNKIKSLILFHPNFDTGSGYVFKLNLCATQKLLSVKREMATNSMSNCISLTVVNLHGRWPLCGYLPTVLNINLEATSNNSSLLNAKWNVPHHLRYVSRKL